MIIFNQANNNVSNLVMTDENSSFPLSNVLTKYSKEVAKSTSTTTTISFDFTGQDLLLLNTNATSGTIYADRTTSASSTISADTAYSVDTTLDGTITIADTFTVTVNDGVTLTISAGATDKDYEAITFTVGLLKAKDIYFDFGSSAARHISLTLTSSAAVEIGCIIGGDFVKYGFGTKLNRKPIALGAVGTYESSMSSHEALRAATKDDTDFYSGIPTRELTNAGIFVGYGKIDVKDFEISGDSPYIDGEQHDTASVEFE